MTVKVKICGVRNAKDAGMAARLGADFIGMVLHPESRRAVTLESAKRIAQAAREHGAEPVAVCVSQSIADIEHLCDYTGIQTLQLHGPVVRAHIGHLPPHLQLILVQSVLPSGELAEQAMPPLKKLRPARDMLLFDNVDAGSGMEINVSKLPKVTDAVSRVLAGGLTAQNVTRLASQVNPAVVDVSSGVESHPGIKSIEKIAAFIKVVKELP